MLLLVYVCVLYVKRCLAYWPLWEQNACVPFCGGHVFFPHLTNSSNRGRNMYSYICNMHEYVTIQPPAALPMFCHNVRPCLTSLFPNRFHDSALQFPAVYSMCFGMEIERRITQADCKPPPRTLSHLLALSGSVCRVWNLSLFWVQMALTSLVPFQGPKKSWFSGPTPSNAPHNDVARLKTITYRAIQTTGTLIVIKWVSTLQRLSVEINLFLPVNANTGWLIMLLAQFGETGCRYALVLVICRSFQRLNWGSNSLWDAAIADLGWLNTGQLHVLPAHHQPNNRFCKPYANLILTLTNKALLRLLLCPHLLAPHLTPWYPFALIFYTFGLRLISWKRRGKVGNPRQFFQ